MYLRIAPAVAKSNYMKSLSDAGNSASDLIDNSRVGLLRAVQLEKLSV